MDNKPYRMRPKSKDIIYVGIQFLLFGAYVLNIRFFEFELPKIVCDIFLFLSFVGMAMVLLAIMQLNTKLSPFPTPIKGARLIKNGLYKFMRHPIYTGIFIVLFSYGMSVTSSYKIIISTLLLVVFYFKSVYEEKRLLEVFSAYESYQKTTGRFFPKF